MSKKAGKGVLKRLFSKDENSEASSSAGPTVTDKKKKKKGSILRKGTTIRDSPPPDSPGDFHDPQRLSTIFSGQTHAPTVTRAPTVTDYQPNPGYYDEGSVRTPSEIHIHDQAHGGMTSPTVLGGPWEMSPEHTHLPLHAPPSRSASVRQAPSALTRHGTVIHDHGSVTHAPRGSGSGGMGGSFRGTPSHIHPDSMEGHTHQSRSQRTHRSSAPHDAPIYVHGAHGDGFEPIVVNGGAPSTSGNGNYYVVDPAGHQRNASMTRQPTVITPAHAGEQVLKPGDTMEIDPTNPPIFMLDDGVELEINDGNGFMPYDQFMQEFQRRPAPPPPSTFVVHGAGDVIIQDEHGNHIQTIQGRGAEAGRGPPQRYNVNGSTIIVL